MCKICKELERGYPSSKIYYYDKLCTILDSGPNKIEAVYAYHVTPSLDHSKWIKLQLEIVCKRKWSKEYQILDGKEDHPSLMGVPLGSRMQKKNWKKYLPQGKCGDNKFEGGN